jgi:hypothetical protein
LLTYIHKCLSVPLLERVGPRGTKMLKG